ncbi:MULTISPECIES: hypothetical protein [Vibrio harveyi group]|uniref:hypothetical protein n=1 Tax=Vibrio harveyi group TaxID=717610 RepID=UPI00111DA9F0|nr:hypothetical protein [Vibrio parahaemolyticus]EIO9265631.1 hypothetical protein [Vibrio alginolyticus]ELB2876437.1 hypothetical protein [Vibrio alginolyticus]ELB2948407.1 hypothetical protein [Vibrio alginolyticus]TOI16610.1 hypothetical protein CGI65_23355 [Vibrio parahaemolyticus]TOI71662.1 hypothetical protein CGI53_22970 [Vibrio parahaemolyticus]
MQDPSDWINQFVKDAKTVANELSNNELSLNVDDIQNALVEVLNLSCSTRLLYQDLPAKKMKELLSSFDFSKYYPEFICDIELEESIVPNGIPVALTEQTVRSKGEVWRIHKNDADPFPSNPHAHNYPKNLVAHLGNGDLYRKKQVLGKLNKKDLEKLRSLIKNVSLPALEV